MIAIDITLREMLAHQHWYVCTKKEPQLTEKILETSQTHHQFKLVSGCWYRVGISWRWFLFCVILKYGSQNINGSNMRPAAFLHVTMNLSCWVWLQCTDLDPYRLTGCSSVVCPCMLRWWNYEKRYQLDAPNYLLHSFL